MATPPDDIRSADQGGLSPEDWARLRGALEGAIDVSESKRRAWLEAELGDDPAVVDQALELLRLDDDGPATRTPLERGLPDAGLRVGPWVTLRLLGTGGMGAVYLASRADGAFERLVALKLIRPHLGSDDVVARFRRERQVQANLHHPGIARMLDGGATEDGAPYIVMEYVDGLRIDRYCDEYRLTVRERVELFRRVVDAVAYAHERRVVHRDIKPSNILVGTDGQPKLVDFGIAKGLDPDRVPGEHEVTRDARGFVTPAYASPEQLRGLPTSAATDVYSLGVLLYQLLVDRPPLELEGLSPAEIERRVASEEPPPPSENLADAAADLRCTTARGLRGAVRGDLDRIVLYCLRKEPQRRYASVAALGDDLDRYLSGRPVEARPDTAAYRALKFVARNRGPVAAAAGAILVLAVGLTYSLDQNRRLAHAKDSVEAQKSLADARLESLRRLRSGMVVEVERAYVDTPGSLRSVERLMRLVGLNLDEELANAPDDPALLHEIGRTYLTIGRTYYTGRGRHLGRPEVARGHFESGLVALDRARAIAPENSALIYVSCDLLEELAAIDLHDRRLDDAVARLRSAVALVDARPAEERLDDMALLAASTNVKGALGRYLATAGWLDEGYVHIESAMNEWERYLARHPEDEVVYAGEVWSRLPHLATIALARGEPEKALEFVERAETSMRESDALHLESTALERQIIVLCRKKGAAREQLSLPGAQEAFEESVELARAQLAADPRDARARHDVVLSSILAGEFHVRAGRYDAAREHLERAIAAAAPGGRDEGDPTLDRYTARAEIALAESEIATRDLLSASELVTSALGRLQGASERQPLQRNERAYLVRALLASAELRLAQIDALTDVAAAERTRELKRARASLDRAERITREDLEAGLGGVGPAEDMRRIDDLRAACDALDR